MDEPETETHSTPDYDERGWRPTPGTNPIPEYENWDDRRYWPPPPGERETRSAELLRKLRKNALGISFGIVMVASLLDKYQLPYHQPIMIIAVGQFILVGLIEFIIWLCGRVAFLSRLQKRTAELLATLLFGGTIAAIACALNPRDTTLTLMFVSGAMTWAFTGSFWAWLRLHRMNEKNARVRLVMLIKGWMMIPGMCGVTGFICSIIGLVGFGIAVFRDRNEYHPEMLRVLLLILFGSTIAMLLVLPAYKVERRAYRGY